MAKLVRRRGTVLIVVLAVLAVLSLLGTTFVVMSSLERTVSKNYLDEIKAKAVAKSGVAAGVSNLSVDPYSPTLTYWGNDANANGARDAGEDLEGAQSVNTVPVEWAKYPSMAVMKDGNPLDTNHDVKMLNVRGSDGRVRQIGYSGAHDGASYVGGLDIYQLRISDLSGRIYLNDGVAMFGGNASSVSQNLRRILNNLGRMRKIGVPDLGDKVVNHRPLRGYNSLEELQRFLNAEEIRKIDPYVTCHAWVDKNVANPVPLSSETAGAYPVKYYRGETGVYRRGLGKSATGSPNRRPLRWFTEGVTDPNHCAVYAQDELNPQYIEIVHRAPVNVNAASKEVLCALIADVSGFFVSERRTFAPYAPSPSVAVQGGVSIPQKYYSWWTVRQSYDDGGEDADQYGFLYRSYGLSMPENDEMTTAGAGVSAGTLADHIIACRDKKDLGPMQYSKLWYGGQFRTWHQFYTFLDALVENGILADPRPIYFDYLPGSSWDKLNASPSLGGRKFASYAIADALKANFNPNLHLNEHNPDHNLYLRIDKTDLIVNSTEFTFLPTGYYQVESIGRVLRSEVTGGTVSAGVYKIVSEKKVAAEVKVFDVYRETSQRHFYAGKFADKISPLPTNSNHAMEFGPEPDNGPLVYEDKFADRIVTTSYEEDGWRGYKPGTSSMATGWGYEYDGYVTLSTYGGDGQSRRTGARQSSTTLGSFWPFSPSKPEDLNRLTMRACYQWDFDLQVYPGGDRRDLASQEVAIANGIDRVANHSDQEGYGGGPYGPTTGPQFVHRLARSFRLPMNGASAGGPGATQASAAPINLAPFPPGDLRKDGMYTERHAGAAYVLRQDQNFTLHGGAVSFWVKPSFHPEHSGKMRSLFSMSKFHEKGQYRNPAPFGLMFVPGHDMPTYTTTTATANPTGSYYGSPDSGGLYYYNKFDPMYDGNIPDAGNGKHVEKRNGALGVWQFHPASLMGLRAATTLDAGTTNGSGVVGQADLVDVENYALTQSLNWNMQPGCLDTGSTTPAGFTGQPKFPNYLEGHRWTHVQTTWQMLPPW